MTEIRYSLKAYDKPATVVSLCEVLYRLDIKSLDEIANNMLIDIGNTKMNYYYTLCYAPCIAFS